MGTFKQWLGWIVFLLIIPTAALVPFARYMGQPEAAFYLISLPPLFLYFYILGRLGLEVPGEMHEIKPEESIAYQILGLRLSGAHPLGRFIMRLRAFIAAFGLPVFGTYLIYHGVRDGETVGYLLGPLMIWVSGGLWAMTVQFFARRRREARPEARP